MTNWFKRLTGIDEISPAQVRESISIEGDRLVFPSGDSATFGRLQTPKLSDLRTAIEPPNSSRHQSTIREVVADVRDLHADQSNANALFQVASQFNLLEMVHPRVTPERGVGIYQDDPTQGPACAIACGAGTIYRNYFANVDGHIGQSTDRQIDCSADLGVALGNTSDHLWQMQNGYLFPTPFGLDSVSARIAGLNQPHRDALCGELSIGLQWDTEVTAPRVGHRVTQAYCSALPVAYGRHRESQWTEFAKLILDAAYEATFLAATINAQRTGVNRLFLTLLGGGVFGNKDEWIVAAIVRAFNLHRDRGIDAILVSYGRPQTAARRAIDACSKRRGE